AVGKRLEEAIQEKSRRRVEYEYAVNETDRQGIRDQPGITVLHAQCEASVAKGSVPALHGGC
ncbi:MAG: hypothetical protein VYA78_02395, partial [Chloroflexota bacterium]|nr:hypothetical protein [Chloroflexota bacterium]